MTTADVQALTRANQFKAQCQFFGVLKTTDPTTGTSVLELLDLSTELVSLIQETSMQHAAQPMLNTLTVNPTV
jgi:hypothetical protein